MVGDISPVSFLFLWVIGPQWPVFYLSKTKYGQGRSQTPRPGCAAWSKLANLSEYLFLKVAERAWDTAAVFFMMWSSSTFLAKHELLDFTQRRLYYMKASTLMASEKEMRGEGLNAIFISEMGTWIICFDHFLAFSVTIQKPQWTKENYAFCHMIEIWKGLSMGL